MSSKTVVVKSPRKLIEVALPLDKINAAAVREKSIRHGHPSTLHLWWSRNPVAVTINKAMLEIPPLFAGHLPIGPVPPGEHDAALARKDWPGSTGLAEDVRRYGAWMRREAEKRIGHLYPKVEITLNRAENRPDLLPHVGKKLSVVAWVWARTVLSPNPAYSSVYVPLAATFVLATKPGKEAYVEPVIDGQNYHFVVKTGPIPPSAMAGTKLSRGANFECLLSYVPIEPEYIKAEGAAGRMKQKLLAVVAEGPRSRHYLDPLVADEDLAFSAEPEWVAPAESRLELNNWVTTSPA
jgi:putative DNA methylase